MIFIFYSCLQFIDILFTAWTPGRTSRMIFCLELCINVILKIAIFSFQEILSVDNEQWNTDYVAVKTFEPENKINLDK